MTETDTNMLVEYFDKMHIYSKQPRPSCTMEKMLETAQQYLPLTCEYIAELNDATLTQQYYAIEYQNL